jgi:hypothetical protein
MPEDERSLTREVAAFAAHAEHPEPGLVASYHAGSLGSDEAEAVADHLTECTHCASLVLDLDEMLALPDLAAADTGFRPERSARKAFPGSAGTGDGAYALAAFPRWSLRTTPRWVLGAVAALLLVSVGLGLTVVRQTRRLAAKGKPSAGLQVATLQAEGTTRGAEDEVESVHLPATLILPLPTRAADREVEIAVREAEGAQRWAGRTKADRELVTAQLYLPSGSLSAGSYVIDVRLAGRGGGEPMSSFPLQVKE